MGVIGAALASVDRRMPRLDDTPRSMVPNCRSPAVSCVVVLLSFAGTTSCRRAARVETTHDTAYVGVAVGLQSRDRYVNVFKRVQEALDEVNAGRPTGAPILALRRAPDSATTNVPGAAAFRDDPSVIGVVGHTECDATISAASVYDDREHGGCHAIVAVSPRRVRRTATGISRGCATCRFRAGTRFGGDGESGSRRGTRATHDGGCG